jgi:lysophospholipase L1-like esterase
MRRVVPTLSALAATGIVGLIVLAAPATNAATHSGGGWGVTGTRHQDPAVQAATPALGYHLSWRADEAFMGTMPNVTTCRFIAKLTGSGSSIRVEFADPFGSAGFPIVAASVARTPSGSRLDISPGTSVGLTFGGRTSATVQGHGTLLADPVPLHVVPGTTIAVTVTGGAGDAFQKASSTEIGGCTTGVASPTAPAATFAVTSNMRWLTSVQVAASASARTVAALGDSITEGGAVSGPGDYLRWTDYLARSGAFVPNAGVGGNTITGVGFLGSVNALYRQQSLVKEPGISDEVIEIGTNDIAFDRPQSDILANVAQAIALARQHGITPWVTTISPRAASGWNLLREIVRQQINTAYRQGWLSSRGARLIDIDAVVRDAHQPVQLNPAYAASDGLHLNAAGDLRFAQTVARSLGLSGV